MREEINQLAEVNIRLYYLRLFSLQSKKGCNSALSTSENVSSPLETRREKGPVDDQTGPVKVRAKCSVVAKSKAQPFRKGMACP